MEANTTIIVCNDYLFGLCPYDLFLNTASSLGKCPKLHDEETKKLINDSTTISLQSAFLPEYSEHLKNLKCILEDRNRNIAQTKFWRDSYSFDTDETKALKEEIKEENKKIYEKQNSFDELHDEDIKEFSDLLLEQDMKCDRLAVLLDQNRSEIKLNVCSICGQYVPYNISESARKIHRQNNVHQAYLQIESRIAEIKKGT